MAKAEAFTGAASGLQGSLEVWTIPAGAEPDLDNLGEPTWQAKNLVVNSASDVIVGLLLASIIVLSWLVTVLVLPAAVAFGSD